MWGEMQGDLECDLCEMEGDSKDGWGDELKEE